MGTESDFGKRFRIRRAPSQDQALYQTERWNDASFSYKIPVKEDGDYVLVLKFSEVYFNAPEEKVKKKIGWFNYYIGVIMLSQFF